MIRSIGIALLPAAVLALWPGPGLSAQDYGDDLEARVWFDRGVEPVLERGDRVRVYYRASQDAYVAIFRIDTDGRTDLVFPGNPQQDNYVRGGRDYRLLERRSTQWYVRDEPGVGYYFIVASPDPLELGSFEFSRYDGEWNLDLVGNAIYTDPYAAMDDFVEAMIPDWEYAAYALDYAEYRVGSDYHYPRFLCYDCHSYRPYNVWNPYLYACTSFRVVIWDRPWFYPASRYRGNRVVYTRRPVERPRRYTFKERAEGESHEPLRRSPGANPGESAPRRTGRDGLLGADGNPNDRARRTGIGSGAIVQPRRGATIGTPRGGGSGRSIAPPVRRTRPSGGQSARRRGASTARGSGSVRVRERPVLERRRPPRPSSRARPSVRRRGGSSAAPSRPGSSTARPARPSAGSSRSSGSARRPTRPGGSSGSVRRPTRSSGSSGSVRRPIRSGGSSSTARPSRGSRSSGSARPSSGAPPRSRGAVRSSGPSRSRAPARKPANRRRPRGGGGGA